MTFHTHHHGQIAEELYDIFESSFDEIFVTDANGTVIMVNSTCEQYYGLSKSDFVGKHVRELEEQGIFYPSASLQVIESKQALEIVQKTDKSRYLHVRARPIFYKNGKLKSVISYSRDLTDLMELSHQVDKMEQQIEFYKRELVQTQSEISGIIVHSDKMKKVFQFIERVSVVDTTVLILGETGVGKSRIARLMHDRSSRKTKPYYEVNCAALPETLIEAELFGYEGGSFTGGLKQGKKGLIEKANFGTLFLDEVGELSLSAQSKLLYVLQEKKVRPIGGTREIKLDIRIVAATNQPLEEMVKKGTFRRDLYYRLNVIPLYIPPLRERREDIIPLVHHFLTVFNERYNRSVEFSPKVFEAFLKGEWPGNIREIENMVERLVVTSERIVTIKDVPFLQQETYISPHLSLQQKLEELECRLIQEAYEEFGSSYKVAEELGISQSSAIRKIQKYTRGKE
ncbi:sigma-54 interaction domain-containing protein [Priestia endophytica]|uniref:sigma-54 interaction domain-containing protein n=1 Tax=Priestia endophytica TaxID=135735 RepID=UPI00227E86CE|nr:sigma 54-interacting transcriptional regulator [Priestia endophytica]MCY8231120.1 sigma 54-interacting transcriptional regulator [Priestia endophytica]